MIECFYKYKHLCYIPFFVFITSFVNSQALFKVVKQDESKLTLQFDNNSVPQFSIKNHNNTSYINFSKTHKIVSLEKGKPQLPYFTTTIQLPMSGSTSFDVIYSEADTLSHLNVLPSKGNLNRNQNPDSIQYEFDSIYNQNAFYPAENILLNQPFNLGTIRGQVVKIFPYIYNPVKKQLIHYKKIILVIHFNRNQKGFNESINTTIRPIDVRSHESLFLNKNLLNSDKYATISDIGDLLIVSPEAYRNEAKKLRSWKIKRGIQTNIATFKSSENSVEKIKSLIYEAYKNTPNLKYILLIGDSDSLVAYTYGKSVDDEELYSDSYYGQLVGNDLYPEVFVGRIPGNAKEIENSIAKIIEYESNPSTSSEWLNKAVGIGSSEGAGYGDDGQTDWQHQRVIRNSLLSYGYKKVYEFYDGSRGIEDADNNPTSGDVINAFNIGIGLISYTGHGDINTFKTTGLNASHLYQLSNFNNHPFVISVACNHGSFVNGTCISENLLNASKDNKATGVVGMAGSSVLMAWAPPMETQDEFVNLISKIDDINAPATTLGGLFYNAQLSMLEKYINSRGEEVMQTWILFADPSMTFRSKLPETIRFDLFTCEDGNTSKSISYSSNINNSLITLTQNDSIVQQQFYTEGVSPLDLTHLDSLQDFTITSFKTNHIPLSQTINLKTACKSASTFTMKPNPTSENIFIKLNNLYNYIELKLIDINGSIIQNKIITGEIFECKMDVSTLNSGIYFVEIKTKEFRQIEKIIIQH